jgi:hypothetical protein
MLSSFLLGLLALRAKFPPGLRDKSLLLRGRIQLTISLSRNNYDLQEDEESVPLCREKQTVYTSEG